MFFHFVLFTCDNLWIILGKCGHNALRKSEQVFLVICQRLQACRSVRLPWISVDNFPYFFRLCTSVISVNCGLVDKLYVL